MPNPTADRPPIGHFIDLECRSWKTCPSYGRRRRVRLDVAAVGVLAKPAFLCADCHMDLMTATEQEDSTRSLRQ